MAFLPSWGTAQVGSLGNIPLYSLKLFTTQSFELK